MEYKGSAVDLSEDFTVAASNVITTLAFGKEVSPLIVCPSEYHKICFSSVNSCGCGRPVFGWLFIVSSALDGSIHNVLLCY